MVGGAGVVGVVVVDVVGVHWSRFLARVGGWKTKDTVRGPCRSKKSLGHISKL